MRLWSFALFLGGAWGFYVEQARADVSLSPRYEYIAGQDFELADRLIIPGKLNWTQGSFGIYLEAFAEFDANRTESEIRRSPNRGYLQEGYLEYKNGPIYFRVGQQALRWSEMWIVPSLDIWTGHRWNRLFFDPLAEQLVHPIGASFSYATQSFSLDAVGITQLAESTYPEPLPETISTGPTNSPNGGLRVQSDGKGFHFTEMAAKQNLQYIYGLGVNYAFDSFVPKLEFGLLDDHSVTLIYGKEFLHLASFGVDVFWGNWTFVPQVSFFDFTTVPGYNNQVQSAFYISGQYKVDPHDFQAQAYFNSVTKDSFWSLSYSYNLTNHYSLGGFVQEYYGEDGGLYTIYREITSNGAVAGLRFEATGDLPF